MIAGQRLQTDYFRQCGTPADVESPIRTKTNPGPAALVPASGGAQSCKPGTATRATLSATLFGRSAFMVGPDSEMIPYTPEEFIAIGQKELAWCDVEMKKASREMG